MKPEYFPHGEDVILQNEAPTDMYILVNGAVVSSLSLSCGVHLFPLPLHSCMKYAIISNSNPTCFLVTGSYFAQKCSGTGKRPTF